MATQLRPASSASSSTGGAHAKRRPQQGQQQQQQQQRQPQQRAAQQRQRQPASSAAAPSSSAAALSFLAAPTHNGARPSNAPANPPRLHLPATNTAERLRWFHARKTRALEAREVVAADGELVATLEGDERAACGDFVCRGVRGELWPQRAERLRAHYVCTRKPTTRGGWSRWLPSAASLGVWAARVTRSEFAVDARWGVQRGKRGDYVVCPCFDAEARDTAQVQRTDDVWVVDAAVFGKTYARSQDERSLTAAMMFMATPAAAGGHSCCLDD